MYKIQIMLDDFSSAHRLGHGYSGKCQNLHGHNYSVSVIIQASNLNSYDFVIDFGKIKKLFNDWIQDNLDHVVILSGSDRSLLRFLKSEKQKHYLLPENHNTTVERIAETIFCHLQHIIEIENDTSQVELRLCRVEVKETQSNYATYSDE